LSHFLTVKNEADRRYGVKRYSKETHRLYGLLDKRLGDAKFVGGDISIADFAILSWAWRHERRQIDFAQFPNVGRWYETLMAHPAVQRGFVVTLSDKRARESLSA
jgi:GSH-dependent disulfide-bond oxidoreductase